MGDSSCSGAEGRKEVVNDIEDLERYGGGVVGKVADRHEEPLASID